MPKNSTSNDSVSADGVWFKDGAIGLDVSRSLLVAYWSCRCCSYQVMVTDESKTRPGFGTLLRAAHLHWLTHGRS